MNFRLQGAVEEGWSNGKKQTLLVWILDGPQKTSVITEDTFGFALS